MLRSVLTSIITVTALAFCAAIVSPAEARKRGKTNLYMTQGTRYNVMPYDYSGRYGSSVLPGSLGPFFPR